MSKVLYLRVSDEVHAAVMAEAATEGRSMAKQGERILIRGLEATPVKKKRKGPVP